MKQCTVCGAPMPPGELVCGHCGRAHYAATCERCGQSAPTLVRGGAVVCAGCGATRGPLSGVPLNLVGSAHRVGGVVTGVLAWAVLLGGVAVGGLVGVVVALVAAALSASAWIGLATGVLLGGVAALAALLLMSASRRLRDHGANAKDAASEQAILAMAASRKGVLTTTEVAQNLQLPLRDADRLLSSMGESGRAQLEVNGDGLLQYSFTGLSTRERTGVRFEAASPGDEARARVDEEFEAMSARRRDGRL
jgi:hypothetical protein